MPLALRRLIQHRESAMTTSSIGPAAGNGAQQAIAIQDGVGAAKTDLNHFSVFAKFIKKAEEAAQAAI
jgi:hypothetical protein